MHLFLKRDINPRHTIGKLYELINDEKVYLDMYTLELPVRSNRKGLDAIPAGTYEILMTYSPKFSKKGIYKELGGLVPLIANVPNRSGIRIHVANYLSQLEGCIAPGLLRTANGDVIDSRPAYRILHAKLLTAWNAKEKILITIE